MFKKILLALAIFVGACFATWDYYPIPDSSYGSFEAGLYYDKDHRWSQAGLVIGARFTMIKHLEISFTGWGYQFWNEEDCANCINGGDGLRDLTIGGRYEVAPMVTAFLDFNLPVGRDEHDGYNTHPPSNGEFSMYLGAQLSIPTKLKGFKFGTEGGILWGFEYDERHYAGHYSDERGLDIHLGAEAAYTIPNVGLTPYFGFLLKFRLTESEWYDGHDNEYGYGDRKSRQFNLWLGASYAINKMIEVKAHFIFRHEKYRGIEDVESPFHLGGNADGIYMGVIFNF